MPPVIGPSLVLDSRWWLCCPWRGCSFVANGKSRLIWPQACQFSRAMASAQESDRGDRGTGGTTTFLCACSIPRTPPRYEKTLITCAAHTLPDRSLLGTPQPH